MVQAKFSLDNDQVRFLEQYKAFGFKTKSALIREALDHLRREIEAKSLRQSADFYAEVYQADDDLKTLTESALEDWPEE